jgi:hypothetical protein
LKNTATNKLKQVPKGYLIVGINPNQKKHDVVAMTQNYAFRFKFKFENTQEGYKIALDRLREEMTKACY